MSDQLTLFKQPVEVGKYEQAYWKCLKDCWMMGGTIRSFIAGNRYVQIRSKDLALRDEQGAFHILSKWDVFFEFDGIEPWEPKLSYDDPD